MVAKKKKIHPQCSEEKKKFTPDPNFLPPPLEI